MIENMGKDEPGAETIWELLLVVQMGTRRTFVGEDNDHLTTDADTESRMINARANAQHTPMQIHSGDCDVTVIVSITICMLLNIKLRCSPSVSQSQILSPVYEHPLTLNEIVDHARLCVFSSLLGETFYRPHP
jgi:hypothetical protein